MKTLYILIMPILILSVSSYLKPVHGDNTGGIEIENIQALPRVIMTEHLFKINATLVNNSTNPVLVENGACDAPFSVAFDSHVLVRKNDIFCTLQLIVHRIDPSREMTFSSPYSALSYVAENGGPVNATLTFPYKRWSPENQSYVKESISKSFSFTIWNSTKMPILSTSENQTIIDTALAIPELQDWSHDWRYISMGFLGNNKLGTPYFKWQYAIINLKAPSSSAPFPCNNDWWAWVDIDITTMKVVRATYPTLESHPCQFATGGGPGTLGSEPSGNTTIFESPLKQFKSGIATKDVQCDEDLQLVIRKVDGSPACVKPETLTKLVLWNWAQNPLPQFFNKFQSNEKNELFYKVMNLHGLKDWSKTGWRYSGADHTFSDVTGAELESTINLSLPPGMGNPPLKCPDSRGWFARVEVNMTTLDIINASFPDIKTASCEKPPGGPVILNNQTESVKTLPASFMPCETPFSQSNAGVAVLYMPMNSIGKICVRYSNLNDFPAPAGIRISKANDLTHEYTEVSSWNDLVGNTIPKGNSTVVYWIKTGNQAGFYGLTIFCVPMGLAVGYDNDSRIVSGDFPWFGKQFECPMQSYEFHIDSLSGIGVKYIPFP